MVASLFAVGWLLLPDTTRAGELEQFFYVPLPGAAIADLTSAPEFPEQPFVVTPVNWFHTGLEGITNASTAYGSWLRGYLEAPVSGDYTFYLSADDSANPYLSTDRRAADTALLASMGEFSVPHGGTISVRGSCTFSPIRRTRLLPRRSSIVWCRSSEGRLPGRRGGHWRLPCAPVPGYR